ncbi:MAG: adenylate/guanylate cyclase domain-containing protein [Coleofasciculaceae cyanobacterium]
MTLRQKTLLLIGLTLAGLIGVLYASLSLIFLVSFAQIEERNAQRNIRRVQQAVFGELESLKAITADYAEWDDTYAFIEDANEEYIDENLLDATFEGLKLNLFLFFNSKDQLVFGRGFSLDKQQQTPVPETFKKYLANNSSLLNHPDTESSTTGIVMLPEGPLMIASHPILTSQETGPIRGSLMGGSYLNSQKIKALAEITQLNLKLYKVSDSQLTAELQAVLSELEKKATKISASKHKSGLSVKESPIKIEPLNSDVMAGYTLLPDIEGKPALLLQVNIPREIYQQGQISLRYLILSLLIVGIVFTVVTLLLLEKMVLSRLANLSTNVKRIGTSSDLSLRVAVTGKDELTSLAETINSMLAALDISSQNLLIETEKVERLLLNILPDSIAKRLKQDTETIADSFEEVTVLFADLVDFTKLSGKISPTELVGLLNEIFSRFDRLVERYGLEKIKTIGDSYMVVGGLPVPRPDHAEAVAEFALAMQQEIEEFNQLENQKFIMRIGINTGAVVAGVIGIKKFIYDLWGDAVNIASRMESHGIPGYIQVSSSTYELLKGKYVLEKRGIIEIKGKGEMTTYLLTDRKY